MRISVEQRRARLALRQGLARPYDGVVEAAESVVVLHATDPATVFLSLAARLRAPGHAAIERALYEDGDLVRMHGMRRTLFVVPADLVAAVQASSTASIAARERKQLARSLAESGYAADWLAGVEASVLAALRERGEPVSGAELGELVSALREQLVYGAGKSYEATQSVGMRLLLLMGMEGALVRRTRVGTWVSGAHRWGIGPEILPLDPASAQAELARRWLSAFGPGTEADLKWWTGWNLGAVRKALAALEAVAVELDGGETGYVLPGDVEDVPEPEPWAALLPALDPTTMGWQGRGWYLADELRPELFDRTGNVGPTVWWNGRVVGGWATTAGGDVVWKELADVGADARAAVEAEAARLSAFLDGAKVTPRFRTPLERSLATG